MPQIIIMFVFVFLWLIFSTYALLKIEQDLKRLWYFLHLKAVAPEILKECVELAEKRLKEREVETQ